MGIKTIPLSRLQADPEGTLSECADSGQALVAKSKAGPRKPFTGSSGS